MHRYLTPKDIDRFWSKVDRSGGDESCWLWKGSTRTGGYGDFHLRIAPREYRHVIASRMAWMMNHGDIPEGMIVCHTCDTPACCNPRHLFVGTYRDNNRDTVNKGRGKGQFRDGSTRGAQSFRAKVSEQQVMEIRQRAVDTDIPFTWMAKEYGISDRMIADIVDGKYWVDVPHAEPTVHPDEAKRIQDIRQRRGRKRKSH